MADPQPDARRSIDGTDSTTDIEPASPTTSIWKVLGELDAPDGVGVLGHNTASSGASVGVAGRVESPNGFGLYTSDDARVDGTAHLNTLAGSLTGGKEITHIAGQGLTIDGAGNLDGHTLETNTFTTAGTTWNAATGLSGLTPVEVTVDMNDVAAGIVELDVDGSLEDEAGAGNLIRRVVGPTSSVSVTSDVGPTFTDSFSVSGEDTIPDNVTFSSDGTKMFVVDGSKFLHVFVYDLSTAWDLSTASFTTRFSFWGQDEWPMDIAFRDDGARMFLLGSEPGHVYAYDLSTAWDLSTANFATGFDVSGEAGSPTGLAFKDDGTKLFVSARFTGSIYAYDLSTAWDISTASFATSLDVSGEDGDPSGLGFKTDGTKLFVSGVEFDSVYSYDLSTAWDLSTASFDTSFDVSGHADLGLGVVFEDDGTKLFVCGDENNNVTPYSLSTAWDLSTASFSTDITVAGQDPLAAGVAFKGDGTMMFVSGDGNNSVYSYSLSTSWDLTTASFDTSFDVSGEDEVPRGIALESDGTKLFVCGASTDTIYSYDLPTAWDLSTASFLTSLDVAANVAGPTDLAFEDDGTKLFVSGVDYTNVRSYSLSTAWDLSTASSTTNLGVSDQDFEPSGLAFEGDGTKMYVLGARTGNLYSYSLSTAWDLSSATFGFAFDVSDEVNSPMGLTVRDADWRLYMGDNSRSDIHEFAREYDGTAFAVVKRA